MNGSSNSSTPTATLDQADEEILAYAVSDEALEAAAGTERGATTFTWCCSRIGHRRHW
jgi:hypothetical protein